MAVDRAVGVSPVDAAAAWGEDAEARQAGLAAMEELRGCESPVDVLAHLVIPLAVNPASFAACALVGRMARNLRPAWPDSGDLEIVAATGAEGERVVVARAGGARR